MLGLLRWPRLEVVWRGSWPSMRVCGFMRRKASMTTLPLTDWMGSITTATARGVSCSKDCCVLMSTLESQQPKPGCEWYQPTTVSGLKSFMLAEVERREKGGGWWWCTVPSVLAYPSSWSGTPDPLPRRKHRFRTAAWRRRPPHAPCSRRQILQASIP